MIQRRRHVALFLVLDERLEHPDGCAMDVARDEADAHMGRLGVLLQLKNEPVSFLLVRLGGPMVVLQLQVSIYPFEPRNSVLPNHQGARRPR